MNKYYKYKQNIGRPPASDAKQFKGLKAETYDELGGRYAITINPEDPRGTDKGTFDSSQDPKEHIKEVYENHKQEIYKKLKYCELIVQPEISPTGRLHYHGVLTVIDTVMFLWHDVQIIREHAQCEIDTIADTKVWEEYITKQKHLMEKYGLKEIHIKNRKEENNCPATK